MSIKQWMKLFFSIMVVCIACFALVIYENNALATIGASSASILLPAYTVGSEYDATITKQYVNLGDYVKTGQKLFEFKSDQLTADIATGQLNDTNLTVSVASDGVYIITAPHDGVITQINALAGSFVSAGTSMATITGTNDASVRTNFELSGPQYAKVQSSTPVVVTLGAVHYNGIITGITQQSENGHTITVITATLPAISKSQTIYANGTPASARLILSNNTIYDRIVKSIRST